MILFDRHMDDWMGGKVDWHDLLDLMVEDQDKNTGRRQKTELYCRDRYIKTLTPNQVKDSAYYRCRTSAGRIKGLQRPRRQISIPFTDVQLKIHQTETFYYESTCHIEERTWNKRLEIDMKNHAGYRNRARKNKLHGSDKQYNQV